MQFLGAFGVNYTSQCIPSTTSRMQLLRGVWGDVSLVLLVECSSLGAFGVIYTSQCIPSTTSRMQLLRGVWGELHITMYP